MSVDHCFSIKGQGTVMTGTILSGSISLGDSVEIPALKVGIAFSLMRLSSSKGGSWPCANSATELPGLPCVLLLPGPALLPLCCTLWPSCVPGSR